MQKVYYSKQLLYAMENIILYSVLPLLWQGATKPCPRRLAKLRDLSDVLIDLSAGRHVFKLSISTCIPRVLQNFAFKDRPIVLFVLRTRKIYEYLAFWLAKHEVDSWIVLHNGGDFQNHLSCIEISPKYMIVWCKSCQTQLSG